MKIPVLRHVRRFFPLLFVGAVAAACESETPIAPDVSYSVLIDVNGMRVIGDCEVTAGNEGEFVWQIVANHPEDRRASRSVQTDNFPATTGQVTVGEGAYLLATYQLTLSNIPDPMKNDVTMRFLVTEHDPGGPDPDMDLRTATAFLAFNPTEEQYGESVIGSSSACQVVWDFGYRWTVE